MRSQPLLKYGLTEDQIEQLLADQDGTCLMCPAPATCVDHDHGTGVVRGMLCHDCNRGLGLLGDSVNRLRAGIAYLSRTPPVVPPSAASQGHDCDTWCPGYTTLRAQHIGEGRPVRDMAVDLGVPPADLLAAMAAHNVPRRGKEHVCGVRNRCPGLHRLQALYADLSIDQLGVELGVADTAARRFLRIHGIATRGPGRRPRVPA